jgi:hypothetical protein
MKKSQMKMLLSLLAKRGLLGREGNIIDEFRQDYSLKRPV